MFTSSLSLRKIISVLFLLLGLTSLYATDIKGHISAINKASPIPYSLEGAKVDLYIKIKDKWEKISRYITQSDGMYYFKEINSTECMIQVNGNKNYSIIIKEENHQDIPPIVISYE